MTTVPILGRHIRRCRSSSDRPGSCPVSFPTRCICTSWYGSSRTESLIGVHVPDSKVEGSTEGPEPPEPRSPFRVRIGHRRRATTAGSISRTVSLMTLTMPSPALSRVACTVTACPGLASPKVGRGRSYSGDEQGVIGLHVPFKVSAGGG